MNTREANGGLILTEETEVLRERERERERERLVTVPLCAQ